MSTSCRQVHPQITKLRQDARQARGAEADSSVATHQLEEHLAVAANEHKQDVRRLTEAIEVRVTRQQSQCRPLLPLLPLLPSFWFSPLPWPAEEPTP